MFLLIQATTLGSAQETYFGCHGDSLLVGLQASWAQIFSKILFFEGYHALYVSYSNHINTIPCLVFSPSNSLATVHSIFFKEF